MVDLTKYTGLRRQGKKCLHFGRICDDYDFPTERETRNFERLYNSLATNALEGIISDIRQGKLHINANVQDLKPKQLATYASGYFMHPEVISTSASGFTSILEETRRLYALSKDIKFLKKLDLI